MSGFHISGFLTLFLILFLLIQLVLLFLLPFFVLKIRNTVIDIEKSISTINKNVYLLAHKADNEGIPVVPVRRPS